MVLKCQQARYDLLLDLEESAAEESIEAVLHEVGTLFLCEVSTFSKFSHEHNDCDLCILDLI